MGVGAAPPIRHPTTLSIWHLRVLLTIVYFVATIAVTPVPITPTMRHLAAICGALALAGPVSLSAQSGFEASYGRWWMGSPSQLFALSYHAPLLGPIDYSVGGFHLRDGLLDPDRTQTGASLSVALWRDGSGPYAVAGADLGMRHTDGNLDAAWRAGAGYSLSLLGGLALAAELRYRTEDRWVRGFWQLDPNDQRGWTLSARLALSTGSRSPRPTPTRSDGAPTYRPPSREEITRAASDGSLSEESAELAADVVETALSVMGTPYQWGGTDEDGYDCSGLIQYAYGEHGILLPRTSRDQSRLGVLISKDMTQLRPGDILGFSTTGSGVTHVGLYVGDGSFIHSSSSGVKLSSLEGSDGDSRYWRERWVSVRRILN